MCEEGHGHLLYPGQVQEGGYHKLEQATTFPVATDNSTRLDRFMEKDDHVLSHLLDGGEDQLKFQHLTVFLGLQCFQILIFQFLKSFKICFVNTSSSNNCDQSCSNFTEDWM